MRNNTNVYSVLKKYKEREKRIKIRDKIYKPILYKIELEWDYIENNK